ncbi:HNH endonuclease signature motif containing protein [Mycobacterium avium]|uniref:HNH endonuclease signature motif containing protein n=2 Tax=Mycobacterium avium TaxID=1764 RepID=UPI002665F0A0|nr:HNH endonuclease signature motif containing protein [Mycobacterium avium]MDO2352513.1 HNH endonuclease signature motif containing protein [Mycobacterium avium subsp. hominissuis]
MHSSTREEIRADVDALRAAVSRVLGHSYDALTTPERLRLLEIFDRETRRLRVPGHQLINQLAEQSDPTELGGRLSFALAERLHITRSDASRRIAEAADLGPRRALTGEPLPPLLPATAAAQRDGAIGTDHVAVIRQFFDQLPEAVDVETCEHAERQLAAQATQFRPDQLSKLARRLMDCLNPDGRYSDEDRARARGLVLGNQQADGMSRLSGWLTPEARAGWEAVLAKLAAPGMCNPDDDAPVVDGPPPEAASQRDSRSAAQRNHDGLNAALRALLAGGKLGQHNGLPASIIVTTTLRDLESAAGKGLTGGGTLLPMSEVIRLARHAHHYLAVFDNGKPLALYHTKRLASPGQRIVLYAKDRGCSHPGCDVSGYYCEVHHVTGYAKCGRTDIDQLTFACGGHHPLAEQGWITRKNGRGETEWIPPPHLERGQPRVNSFHHPEDMLCDTEDQQDQADQQDGADEEDGAA